MGYYTILWRWNAIRIIICLILEGFNIISDWPFGKLLFLWKLRYLYDLVHACGCLTQKKKKSVKSNNRLPKERKQKKAWYWSKRLAQPKIYQPTYCPTNCQGLLNSLNTQSIYHGMEQRQHLHFCDGKNQTLYAMEVPPRRQLPKNIPTNFCSWLRIAISKFHNIALVGSKLTAYKYTKN